MDGNNNNNPKKLDEYNWFKCFGYICLISLFIIFIIGIVVLLFYKNRPRDLEIRDLCARIGMFADDVIISGNVKIASTMDTSAVATDFIKIKPFRTNNLIVTLDGLHSVIILENQSSSIINVILPNAQDNEGKIIYIFNKSSNPQFTVAVSNTDMINGTIGSTVTGNNFLRFYSVGLTMSGAGEWIQI